MAGVAYVNGKFCELDRATVSVEDRGFQFADAVYEGIVVYDGKPFRLREHLARLRRSAEAVRLTLPHTDEQIERILDQGIRRCGCRHVFIYLQLTRGAAPRSHAIPAGLAPTVVVIFKPRPAFSPELRQNGVAVVTCFDERWARCRVKTVMLLPNVLAKQEALDRGAYDAIFVGPNDVVYEATSSNLFVVRDGQAFTPPKSDKILPGITCDYIIESLERIGVGGGERTLLKSDLFDADEVFLSGTMTEALGVVRIDDRPIGDGRVGPVTRRIYRELFECLRDENA